MKNPRSWHRADQPEWEIGRTVIVKLDVLQLCRQAEGETPARLSFAKHMNRFIAGSSCAKLPKRSENVGLRTPAFDGPGNPVPGCCSDTVRGGVGNCRLDRLRLGGPAMAGG
jgi:hypothetical protein